MRLQLNIRFSEGTFEVFWTSPALPSPRENREFTEGEGEGRRLRILDSQRLPFGASWTLLVSLSSPRENREFMEERAGGSEFSILRDCVFESTSYASPCENRGFVDRGLGGAELVILREDFSGGEGTSFPSFKSLFSYLLNSEFVFDKPQSVIRTGILHIALVVGGDALHHLSVAVIAGDLYGGTRLSSSLMST